MKYLKSYRVYEFGPENMLSSNEITILSDICDEIRDDGYEVTIDQPYLDPKSSFWFKKVPDKNAIIVEVNLPEDYLDGITLRPFSFTRVKEAFDRMDAYMKGEGWKSELLFFKSKMGGGSWVPFAGKNTEKHGNYRIKFFH